MNLEFYENTDNNHCLQCCVRMVINTIFTEQISETDIDKESEYEPSLWTWTISGAKVLSQKIDNVKVISEFNYNEFKNKGEPYLKNFWRSSRYEEQRKHASESFKKERRLTEDFLNGGGLVEHENLSKENITNLLKDNFLIAQVNHSLLYNLPNSSSHYVLIHDDTSTDFKIHDPGKEPRINYMVKKEQFLHAFSNELIAIPKPAWWSSRDNVGRNKPCPCGKTDPSGKRLKFKKCCGRISS